MKYQIAVYFDGPRSRWEEKLHPEECTFISQAPWLWLARAIVRGNLGNTGRLAYAITAGDEMIEHRPATTQAEVV